MKWIFAKIIHFCNLNSIKKLTLMYIIKDKMLSENQIFALRALFGPKWHYFQKFEFLVLTFLPFLKTLPRVGWWCCCWPLGWRPPLANLGWVALFGALRLDFLDNDDKEVEGGTHSSSLIVDTLGLDMVDVPSDPEVVNNIFLKIGFRTPPHLTIL